MALAWFWNWKLLIFFAWVCCGAAPSSFTKCVKSSQLCDGDVNGKPNCNSPLLLPFWTTLLLKKSKAKKGATIFALLTCQICFCPCNQVIEFAKKQNRRGAYIKSPSATWALLLTINGLREKMEDKIWPFTYILIELPLRSICCLALKLPKVASSIKYLVYKLSCLIIDSCIAVMYSYTYLRLGWIEVELVVRCYATDFGSKNIYTLEKVTRFTGFLNWLTPVCLQCVPALNILPH